MDTDFQLYLASTSPRRAELLRQLGLRFRHISGEVEERPQRNEEPTAYVSRIAEAKARTGWSNRDSAFSVPVLGADTEVVIDGQILGKPNDREHGVAMLQQLSGKTHYVLSVVAFYDGNRLSAKLCTSEVTFRAISKTECESYWDTGEPNGKAGGYAVQGIGAIFISRLCGSYSGVMGLPLFETAQLINEFKIKIFP